MVIKNEEYSCTIALNSRLGSAVPYKADENELTTFRQLAEEVEKKDALKTQRPANELF